MYTNADLKISVNVCVHIKTVPVAYGTPLGALLLFLFVRICMKLNTFFAFVKLSFLKTILTSHNVSVKSHLRTPHKTSSRPSFKAHAF